MRRPSIPYKPNAPSIHPVAGKVSLRDKRRALERIETMTEAELIAEVERDLQLPPGFLEPRAPTE